MDKYLVIYFSLKRSIQPDFDFFKEKQCIDKENRNNLFAKIR